MDFEGEYNKRFSTFDLYHDFVFLCPYLAVMLKKVTLLHLKIRFMWSLNGEILVRTKVLKKE